MSEPEQIGSFEQLVKLFERRGLFHRKVEEQASLEFPVGVRDLVGMQVIRWLAGENIVQFIQTVPVDVPLDRLAEIESGLCRLNAALSIPGFELYHEPRVINYRTALPLLTSKTMSEADVDQMFQLVAKNAATFLPTLQRLASGETRPEEIVADAQKELAAVNAMATPPPEGA